MKEVEKDSKDGQSTHLRISQSYVLRSREGLASVTTQTTGSVFGTEGTFSLKIKRTFRSTVRLLYRRMVNEPRFIACGPRIDGKGAVELEDVVSTTMRRHVAISSNYLSLSADGGE